MLLAQVLGNVTSTVRHPSIAGVRLLVARQLDTKLNQTGDPQLILDTLGAGVDDVVLISSDGRGLRDLLQRGNSPARWYAIGLVDDIDNVRRYISARKTG